MAQVDAPGVAIVGMACRFPGHANSLAAYWQLLCAGIDATGEVPAERFDIDAFYDPDPARPGRLNMRRGAFIDAAAKFDARFFGISAREARQIDPQQRLLLEIAWEAIEDAGITAQQLRGSRTGVFIGISTHDFADRLIGRDDSVESHHAQGSTASIAANRISYAFDLRGPSVAVDTACSSSLTAVHLARRSLAAGDCNLAIVGGVNLFLIGSSALTLAKASMLAPDGRCKAFSAQANGYARGEGAGIVVLKRADDAQRDHDRRYAIVRGSAINQDGRTVGISVPSQAAQASMMREALAEAGLEPGAIQYVEAHGTGTPVGDPIEAAAIGAVFAPERTDSLIVGSVKTNIAHLEAAAGVAGLIKTVLALRHRTIPPNLHCDSLNPAIPFDEHRITIPKALTRWPQTTDPARAGVNSFGFGGSNAHIVIEEVVPPRVVSRESSGPYLLPLSAKSADALRARAAAIAALLREGDVDLDDLCHSAALRRTHFEARLAVVAGERDGLAAALAAAPDIVSVRGGATPKLGFVFSGMGPQRAGMALELMRAEPRFRDVIERCGAGDALSADQGDPAVAQLTNYAVQAGLVELLAGWGIVPDMVTGHSSGEIAAAYAAGAISLEDGRLAAYHRGRLVREASGRGGMLGVTLGEAAALELIAPFPGRVDIAAINSANAVTLAGDSSALELIATELERRGVGCRMLDVTVPYHSSLIDGLEARLVAAHAGIAPSAPKLPMASATSGTWAEPGAFDSAYWGRNFRRPVRFADAVARLVEVGCTTFLEIGPHPVLRGYLAQGAPGSSVIATLRRGIDDRVALLEAAGALHVRGHAVDWHAIQHGRGRLISLPGYPWQHEDFGLGIVGTFDSGGTPSGHPLLGRRLPTAHPTWQVGLGDSVLAYLDDHRVGGVPVLAGAAYIEMAIAAARAGSSDPKRGLASDAPVALERVVFEHLLDIDDRSSRSLQIDIGDDGHFRVHARRHSDAWIVQAHGRIARAVDLIADAPPIDAPPDAPPEHASDSIYARLAAFGFEYAGPFHSIRWMAGMKAGIGLPEGTDVAPYCIHPGLLDSALQTLVIASGVPPGGTTQILPIGVDRIDFYRPAGRSIRVQIDSIRSEAPEFAGDLSIFTDDGAPVMRLRGMRAVRTGTPAALPLHQLAWIPRERQTHDPRAAPILDAATIEASLGESVARNPNELDMSADALREGRALAAAFASAALAHVDPTQVVAAHRRFHRRLESIAAGARADPEALAARLRARRGWDGIAALVARATQALPDLLTGRRTAQEILFADDEATSALASFYATSRFHTIPLADLIARAARALPAHRRLRVLEVGGGVGGATAMVLDRLLPDRIDYTFTDVSVYFLDRARKRFADRDLRYALLDVEAPPPGQYDVVLAANVLHATADLAFTLANIRRLLAPNGLLLLFEVVRSESWLDVVFGMFDGWWRFSDSARRPDHAILSRAAWVDLLRAGGYAAVTCVPDPDGVPDCPIAGIVAVNPATVAAASRSLLVHGDDRELAERLAQALADRATQCTLVHATDAPPRLAENWSSIVDLAGPSATQTEDTATLLGDQVDCSEQFAARARAAAAATPARWWIVTQGAADASSLTHAPRYAVARTLQTELPALDARLVDIQPTPPDADIDALAAEIAAPDREDEVVLREGQRSVARLRAFAPIDDALDVSAEAAEIRIESGRAGSLAAIEPRILRTTPLAPNEVRVRVAAVGLNFRDVMLALGLLQAPATAFGLECAGVVTAVGTAVTRFRPGEAVFGLGTENLGTHAHLEERLTRHCPAGLSLEDIATMPIAFLTAQVALADIARVTPGERVLIHSATGGLGLAAIQVCRLLGAQIIATAGSPEKRERLRSLGIEQVFDSRAADFATPIRAATGGEGVDVVLNSLAGDAIRQGIELLRPFGRFVELGKRDLYADSTVGLAPFRRNLAFSAFDLVAMTYDRPIDFERALARFGEAVEQRQFQPLPRTDFPLSRAQDAFRFMAEARHIGKIIITAKEPRYRARRSAIQPLFSPLASYLITGGLGGFGLATARWMIANGARHIVLTGRSAEPRPPNRTAYAELLASGAQIHVLPANVAIEGEVVELLAQIERRLPPLRGVFHAAMQIESGWLAQLDRAAWSAALAPKIAGAWNLHRHSRGLALDYFVLYSSAAVTFATHGLAGYVAGNAFLDALATQRRAANLPALSVAFGAIDTVGFTAERPELLEQFARLGMDSLTPDAALAELGRLLRSDAEHAIASKTDWLRLDGLGIGQRMRYADLIERARASAVQVEKAPVADAAATVLAKIAAVLRTSPAQLDHEIPLSRLGLDSLLAVELEATIRKELGVRIPISRLLGDATIASVVAAVASGRDAGQPTAAPVVVERSPERFPLLAAQRRFWFLQQLEPDSRAYNEAFNVRIRGALDADALAGAFESVFAEEEALQVGFSEIDGVATQWISPSRLRLDRVDVALAVDREAELARIQTELARTRFRLDAPPLVCGALVRLGDDDHAVVVCGHHLVGDLPSMQILIERIFARYQDSAPRPARPTSSGLRQQLRAAAPESAAELAFWKQTLAGVPPLAFPTDRPRSARRSHASARRMFAFPASLVARLDALARAEGVTLFTTLYATIFALLARTAHQDDFCIGTPAANRLGADRERIGCFVNTVALRTRIAPGMGFRGLLAAAKTTVLEALEHQSVSWDRVVAALNPERDTQRTPLFDFLFGVLDLPDLHLPRHGLSASFELLPTGESVFDLVFQLEPRAERGFIEYSTELFDPGTIEALQRDFVQVATQFVEDPDTPIDALALGDREGLLGWGRGTITHGAPACLHELFEAQADRTPEAIALQGDLPLSYRALDRSADALAARLIERGVGPDRFVAIEIERSTRAVIALLGVLKAGGAFAPIDPQWPAARRAQVLDALRPVAVLGPDDVPITDAAASPRRPVSPDHLAYVLFTSGSTGTPRGVMVEHRAIVNQVRWRQAAFPLAQTDVVVHSTALTFDPAIWEVFGPLASGAAIGIGPALYDGAAMHAFLRSSNATILQLVPSALRGLLDQDALVGCDSLRRVFCGGEPIEASLASRLGRLELVGLYGCTETAIDASFHTTPDSAIGRPIDNVCVYVLDAHGMPCRVGVAGELVVAGASVARGYLDDPVATRERFIPDPFLPSARAFRTGDRACWRADGTLRFLGRADRQLKLRGYRIEPGEVEKVLASDPSVGEVVVGTHRGAELIAWVAPARGAHIEPGSLGERVTHQLPEYLRPSRYIVIDALPRTPNGKLDVDALAVPDTASAEVAPHGPVDARVAAIWAELLGVAPRDLDTSFFAAGGHSLAAVQLALRLGLAVRDVYADPTVRGITAHAAARARQGTAPGDPSGH